MLTLFTCPKSFLAAEHIALIQRNALASWCRLEPRPQIILMGDDPGVAEVAREFEVEFLPEIKRNEFGTPLVSDLFAQAQQHARHDILCYINADMILSADFARAIAFFKARKKPFLMVTQRWNLDISAPLACDAPDWDASWPAWVKQNGRIDGLSAIDFFAFSRGLYEAMPPFAIGRSLWDNWLLFEARRRRAILVDATAVVVLAHQNHDYAHVTSKPGDAFRGPESERNAALMGGLNHVFTIENATHRLIAGPRGLELQSTRKAKGAGRVIQELAVTNPSKWRAVGKIATALSQAKSRVSSPRSDASTDAQNGV